MAAGARAPVSWPHRVGVVPARAECFQYRGAVDALEEAVAGGGTAVVCQVLAGTGGVGKTQLAAAHARAAWQAGSVDLLAWVTAGSRDAVRWVRRPVALPGGGVRLPAVATLLEPLVAAGTATPDGSRLAY